VLKHKFQSVGKRYMPSWSVLPILGFKCVCPEIATVIIDNFYLFLIYDVTYVTAPAIAKHMRAGHNWPPARRAYAPEGMLEYWNDGLRLVVPMARRE